VGTDSKVQTSKKIISQANVSFLDRYTGLINPAVLVTNNQDSSSNWGRNFWVGYQRTNGFTSNGQQMVLYLGARDQEANVRVEINGTNWVRNYTVPPFTAITSDLIPKTGPDDARMIAEGQLNRGIHIISDVPIVAYAHIYEAANSGATLLLPVGVWGYEYFTLNSRQYYGTAGSASVFHVIADRDSTWVEITPARPSQAGLQAGVPVVVKLNKGETYQVLGGVLSGSEGQDLSGSIVRSVPNGQGACYPIAVFAGSTRTGIGCGTATGGSGDLIIQQIFPSQAWGTTYLLAPTSNQNGPGATAHMTNKYRVMVRDTATVVLRNGVALPKSGIIRNRYYEFESNTADYIEADNPVLVAQYISSAGSCPNTTGDGDPEMFYLSPLQQAIKQTYFYRNITNAIDENFLTIVVPDEGLNSLNIDGRPYSSYGANEMFAYQHRYAGYTVVTKRWEKVAGASSVECDQPFTGIVYGIGSVESYGYNVGTLVKNLNYSSTIQNQLNTSGVPYDYTCSGAPFFMNALLTLHPDSIYWRINEVPGLTPSANMMSRNPQAMDTVDIGGVTFYVFRLNQSLRMNPPGVYSVPFDYWHPSIEGCDKRQSGTVYLQVLPKHPTNFAVALSGGGAQACAGETATFTGELTSSNGFRIQSWSWQANNGTANPVTGTNRVLANVPYNTAGTYNVTLNSVTQDGCISDTTRQVVIKPVPTVATIGDVTICPGDNAILSIASPVAGTRYYWYTAATGGSPIDSGTSIVVTNPAVGSSYYAEAVLNACISTTRARSSISQYTKLATPVVTLDGATDKEVRFRWTSVAGATRYEIVVRLNGVVSGNPVTVPAGTITYVVSNLPQGTTVEISVRALADAACQASDAGTASGFTYVDQVYIPNVFTPNGDGINDRLYVYSYVVRTMQMAIFNQWGEKVFESNNMLCTNNANCPGTGWDGNFNGKPLPMGVYMFVGKFTLNSGEIVERKGSINLVR
jgi:gliding motility-associated-like protein